MRKELEWYYEREEEIILVGTYFGIDDTDYPLFIDLTNIKTEQFTNHLHVLQKDIEAKGIVVRDRAYIIRGYVTKYKRKDETEDYGLKEIIIEEI